jgi:arylsulfatase A
MICIHHQFSENILRTASVVSAAVARIGGRPVISGATGCDWYPTILELCGLPAAKHRIDGKSLTQIIKSADAPTAHKNFNWKSGRSWAVREGKWKMVVTGKKTELYDIPNDLGEAKNLAREFPEVVTHLKKLSQEYWQNITNKK